MNVMNAFAGSPASAALPVSKRERESFPLPGLRACLAVLICFFLLPARAEAQTINVMVSASTTNVVRGGSPVTLTVQTASQVSNEFAVTASASTPGIWVANSPDIADINFVLSPTRKINSAEAGASRSEQSESFTVTFVSLRQQNVEFSSNEAAWNASENQLTFTVVDAPPDDTIRLRLRVYLEGALR